MAIAKVVDLKEKITNFDGDNKKLLVPSDWSIIYNKPSTFTPATHTHGNITNDGAITADDSIGTGDKLLFSDASNGGKIIAGTLTIDTGNTTDFLRRDGTFATPPGTYSLPLATSVVRGGIKIGFTTDGPNRNYAVQLNNEQAYVNVPWTDTVYTHPTDGANTTITAANGLVLSAITVDSLGHVTSVSSKTLAEADIPNLDTGKLTSGILGQNRGGTGITPTDITDGDLLIGNNALDSFARAKLTAGANISITNGAGSITIANTYVAPVTSVVGKTGVVVINPNDITPLSYTTTTPTTEAWYRLAQVPLSSTNKQLQFRVKGYTATGTTSEAVVFADLAYYSGNTGSQQTAMWSNTSHSFNAWTNAENGYVFLYVRVSFDATNAYLDIYKYKTTAVTFETTPLIASDWVFATGALTANPTAGNIRSTQVTTQAGFVMNTGSVTYASSAGYTNYGMLGGNSISNTTDKTDDWSYVGYIYMDYNDSYLRGRSGQFDIKFQELSYDGTKAPNTLEEFVAHIKVNLGYHANSTAWNTLVPTYSIELEGNTTYGSNDLAIYVHSTTTSQKVLRVYIKLKSANHFFQTYTLNRYGRSFATSSYSITTSYAPIWVYRENEVSVESLPAPAQGSVAYATRRAYLSTDLSATTALVTNLNADLLDGNHASAFAAASHTHGNINNDGTITADDTPGTGDRLMFVDSATGKVSMMALAIDAGQASSYLSRSGSWATPPNWYPTTFAWTGGTTAGPTGSLTGTGMSAVSFAAIPAAGASASGIVTTDTQTFAGSKTFSGSITVNSSAGIRAAEAGGAATHVAVFTADPTSTTRTIVHRTIANFKTDLSLNNVENKSSATIRGEITSTNVTTALGFTPAADSHSHGNITSDGKIGSTTDLVVVTTTAGLLTTQSRSGIDSRATFPADTHNIMSHVAINLTPGHFMKAISATEFGFAAHGLTASDVGAATASHTHGPLNNAGILTAQLTSTLAIGTAPFAVTSTTVNTNLNADYVDGKHASDFVDKATANTITGVFTYNASPILNKISDNAGSRALTFRAHTTALGDFTKDLTMSTLGRLQYDGNDVYHAGFKPTAGDVGLGNVTNESKATMFTNPTFTGTAAFATITTSVTTLVTNLNADLLDGNHASAFEPALTAGSSTQYYRGDKSWQTLNPAAVGLGSVLNYSIATQAEAQAGTSNLAYMTPLRVAEYIAYLGLGPHSFSDHTDSGIGTPTNNQALVWNSTLSQWYNKSLTPSDTGLGNVTNHAQVRKLATSTSGRVPTWNGTTGDALNDGYTVSDSTSNAALAANANLVTERGVYYGLALINGNNQTRATIIYAPQSGGTARQKLISNGAAEPVWETNPLVYTTSSDYSYSILTLVDVTGLTTASLPIGTYKVKFVGSYRGAALTTGIKVGMYLSTGAANVRGLWTGQISAATVATDLTQSFYALGSSNATGSWIMTTGVSSTSLDHYIGCEAIVRVTTAAVIRVQAASEVNGSAATLMAGSTLIIERIA